MNKKSGFFRFLLWICIGLIFNNCVFYKTVPVPVNSQSLLEQKLKKPYWTIADGAGKVSSIVPVIKNDSISGKLLPIERADHPKDSTRYRAKKGPSSMKYLHLYTNSPPFAEEIKIPISEVTNATTHQDDLLSGVAGTMGVTTGVVVVGIIILAIVCGCPHVSVIGTDTIQFQGSLFPGSISQSLERQDHLIMNTIPVNQDGNIQIRISNELPEIEYFNQMELMEVRGMPYRHIGQHVKGSLISYDIQDHLVKAITLENKNIKQELQSEQGGFYDFNEPADDNDLNKVFLTFNRTNLDDEALLVVRAKQSKWMETVAAFTFQQLGTAFDKWVGKLDKTDPAKYNQSMIDKGIAMNAYIKRNNQWDYLGSYADVGTLAYRDLALNVDLSGIKEEQIEIKLEAAHRFWDIDYVGITDAASENIHLSKLKTISAVNHKNIDITNAIEVDDMTYTELPTQGNFIDIRFEAPVDPNTTIILKAKGYYHHERAYTTKPNYKFLKTMDRDKMAGHQLSILLQNYMSTASKTH